MKKEMKEFSHKEQRAVKLQTTFFSFLKRHCYNKQFCWETCGDCAQMRRTFGGRGTEIILIL